MEGVPHSAPNKKKKHNRAMCHSERFEIQKHYTAVTKGKRKADDPSLSSVSRAHRAAED
jgi:hypothetical protein